MNIYKIFIFTFSLTFLFSKELVVSTKDKLGDKVDPLTIWQNEDSNIQNKDLKKELDKLRGQFKSERKTIDENYKESIKPLKKKRDDKIRSLKDTYNSKRQELRKKYGVKKNKKPRKLKKNKIKNDDLLVKPNKEIPLKSVDEPKSKKELPKKNLKNTNDSSSKSKK